MRAPLLMASFVALQACGGGSHEIDGSQLDGGRADAELDAWSPAVDAGPDASDASSDCTASMTEGCACSSPGTTMCLGGMGIQCCGGAWRAFWDGPCRGDVEDAGATDCAAAPRSPGCPCAAGETACQLTGWSLFCSGGVWQERVGHQCC